MQEAVMMQEMLALDLKDEGEALLEDGDLEGALATYTQALNYAPNYRVYAARAACLLRLGRARDAATDSALVVAMLPSFHTGHGLLAAALAEQRDFGAARAAYEKAIFLADADGDAERSEARGGADACMRACAWHLLAPPVFCVPSCADTARALSLSCVPVFLCSVLAQEYAAGLRHIRMKEAVHAGYE
jgi:tetratricopeptide (TPR) repeat protein